MRTLTCANCGETVKVATTRHYCSVDCRIEAQQKAKQSRLDDFLMIAGTDSWENIAHRMGFGTIKRLREWVRAQGLGRWADRITEDGLAERERQGKWAA